MFYVRSNTNGCLDLLARAKVKFETTVAFSLYTILDWLKVQ